MRKNLERYFLSSEAVGKGAEPRQVEDVKVFVGGVDVTAGFKVAVKGTTATVVLLGPYEAARTPHSARFAARLWLGGYR
jgi:hypothetical protein